MENNQKWVLPNEEKQKFIKALTNELSALRAKVGISQDDLSRLIGVSRQTFGSIERGERPMSWNTYLSLIMFFDYNVATHQMIRDIDAFPEDLFVRFNDGKISKNKDFEMESMFDSSATEMLMQLDDQAFNTIRTAILIEYARCANLSNEGIAKAFSGINFIRPDYSLERSLKESLGAIREKDENR